METVARASATSEKTDKFIENPFEWRTGVVAFFALVFGGVAVSVIVCSEALSWPETLRFALLKLFIIWTAFGLFAFVACKNRSGFVHSYLATIALAGPVIATMLAESAGTFWVSFCLVGFTSVMKVHSVFKERWKSILVSIYAGGIAVSVFVTVGLTIRSFARPAQLLAEVFPLLDVRLFVSMVFIMWLGMNAILQTFRAGIPVVKPLPQAPKLGDANLSRPMMDAFLEPLLYVINLISKAFRTLANILWLLIAVFIVFINRTGVNLASHLWSLLFNKEVWRAIMQVLLTLGVVMLFAAFLTLVQSVLVSYLKNNTAFYASISAAIDAATALATIGAFSLLTIFSIIFVCWLLDIGDNIPSSVGYGLSTILVAFSIAGGLMYGLSRIEAWKITGFDSIGLFSLSMVVLLISIVSFYLGKYALKLS